MSRRRVRLITSSSDEEDEAPPPPVEEEEEEIVEEGIEVEVVESTHSLQSVTLNSSEAIHVDISDDDSTDQLPPLPSNSSSSSRSSNECPIAGFLEGLGLRLQRQWLDSCLTALRTSLPGFSTLDASAKAKLCFNHFLYSDFNYTGSGILPQNVHNMHLVHLPGPFVLQVDEIVNISNPLRGRFQNAAPGLKRCLKLSMTDGIQRVFGMEYRPIKDLEVLAPAGLKVAIINVHISHGILMLVPEAFEVLGGLVEELDEARQRLVTEVNKPPRGKRTRTGAVLPLATRATLAAWPTDRAHVSGHTNTSVPPVVILSQADDQGAATGVHSNLRTTEASAAPIHRDNDEPNLPSTTFSGAQNIHMADTVEHPSILAGDKEIPFTYLSSLSAKWAATKDKTPSVQGKIKCFLTGVIGFQYKQRITYELQVYVDDGSLISKILIDHNVVQKAIGYSPEEVTAALTSSDNKRVNDMKETMKKFQYFLINFEGIMLVQMNAASPLPVAIEMNEGLPVSDAWLLLRRLKSSTSVRTPLYSHLEPINLSPN